MNKFLSILMCFACLIACTEQTAIVDEVIAEVKQEFAPDKRVATFEVTPISKGGTITLSGETDQPAAKASLLQQLKGIGLDYEDQIQLLPTADLEGKTYGVVNIAVCNIRSNPKHSSELATQAILGTPLKVLKREEDWYRVQTPDGYLGWLDAGGFEWMDAATFSAWMARPKTIFQDHFGFAYAEADLAASKISDLAAGNILAIDTVLTAFTKVRFPDNRTAYVANTALFDYNEWKNIESPNAVGILTNAYEHLGRPYLWGGTSGRAMDCSGFTKTVFYMNGLLLPRDASQQVHVGLELPYDTTWQNLQPGDLLFFGRKATAEKKERITHVAIHIENGRIIHATGRVKIESLNPKDADFNQERFDTFIRAKRMLEGIGEHGVQYLRDLEVY